MDGNAGPYRSAIGVQWLSSAKLQGENPPLVDTAGLTHKWCTNMWRICETWTKHERKMVNIRLQSVKSVYKRTKEKYWFQFSRDQRPLATGLWRQQIPENQNGFCTQSEHTLLQHVRALFFHQDCTKNSHIKSEQSWSMNTFAPWARVLWVYFRPFRTRW